MNWAVGPVELMNSLTEHVKSRVVVCWEEGVALPVVVIVDVLTGYLSVYFSVYWQLLRTICMGNLATKLKRIRTQP